MDFSERRSSQIRDRSTLKRTQRRSRSLAGLHTSGLMNKCDILLLSQTIGDADTSDCNEYRINPSRAGPKVVLDFSGLKYDYDETMLQRVISRLEYANEKCFPLNQSSSGFSPYFKSLLTHPFGGMSLLHSLSSENAFAPLAGRGDVVLDVGLLDSSSGKRMYNSGSRNSLLEFNDILPYSTKNFSGGKFMQRTQSQLWQGFRGNGDLKIIVCAGTTFITMAWAVYSTNVAQEMGQVSPGFL